jgi:nucleoside-diphosphate-sugar epimerase
MRILVTGGAGYIGSVLVPALLRRGHHVTVLDNLLYSQISLLGAVSQPGFEFVFGDARDETVLRKLLEECDAIVPLAALVGAQACDRDPHLAETLNVGAVRSLLKLRAPSQRIVYPTTNSGYGRTSGLAYCTEETPLQPISLYGRTKVQAEREILEAGNSLSLRLATVFGVSPRMRLDLLVNSFTYEALTRGNLVLFEKEYKRNYVHIEDVADCILFCLERFDGLRGEAYNFGLDEANCSKEELALLIKEQVPRCEIFASDTGRDPDQRNYIVSSNKLAERGFRARRPLSQGIRELITAYRMLPRIGPLQNA